MAVGQRGRRRRGVGEKGRADVRLLVVTPSHRRRGHYGVGRLFRRARTA